MPLAQVYHMVETGKITDMGPVAALGLYRTILEKHQM